MFEDVEDENTIIVLVIEFKEIATAELNPVFFMLFPETRDVWGNVESGQCGIRK